MSRRKDREFLTTHLSISAATSKDVDDLLALVGACVSHMRRDGIEQWDEEYPDRSTFERDVQSGTIFVASFGGATVATLVLNDVQEPEYASLSWRFTAQPTAVVHRLMVRPTMEGRGFAQALMKFAEERASILGYRTIRLDAFTENPRALRFYERLGYRDVGQVLFRKGYFRCFEKELRGPA